MAEGASGNLAVHHEPRQMRQTLGNAVLLAGQAPDGHRIHFLTPGQAAR